MTSVYYITEAVTILLGYIKVYMCIVLLVEVCNFGFIGCLQARTIWEQRPPNCNKI